MIGLLGGTFDPIHDGHLRMAQEICENLRLTQIMFVPASQPPHRGEPYATAQDRAQMVRLAIAGNPLFALDTRELEREGASYTFDTLTSLRAELGDSSPLCLLLGADAFLGLPAWHRWRELFGLAHIIVAHRPGFILDENSPAMTPDLRQEWQSRYNADPQAIAKAPYGCILKQETTGLDISASTIRKLIAAGDNPRYLLPDAVLAYILEHKLYTKGTA